MDILLDTNILLIYLRGNEKSRNLEKEIGLLSQGDKVAVSAVSVGEIQSIAIQNKWGVKRITLLNKILKKFIVVGINFKAILDKYAEIDAYSQGKLPQNKGAFTARNMGKNDLWIAATASVLNIELITTDLDFTHLDKTFCKLRIIERKQYQ